MKHFLLVGGAAALALGLSMAGAGTAQATPFPNSGTVNIHLGTYCDGIAITLPGNAGAPGAQAVRTGCASDPMYGAFNQNAIVLVNASGSYLAVINSDHTWVYYIDCGTGQECVSNSGTWAFGPPAAPAHNGASTSQGRGLFGMQRGGLAGHRFPGPSAATVLIGFNGFCDGEELHIPGSGGAPGVDGTQIGCASDPLIGAGGYNMVAMWDYTINQMWVSMGNHTWIGYYDCGDGTECEFNSGTWTRGAPAAPSKNRTVVPSNGR